VTAKPSGGGLNTNSNISSNENPLFGGANRYSQYAQQNAEFVKNNPINAKPSGALNPNSNVSSNDNPFNRRGY
jgi:hypothetical protein